MRNKTKQQFVNSQSAVDFKQKNKYITPKLTKVIGRTFEIEKDNVILLSQRDLELFLSAVMNPAKPNKALKKAVARYEGSSRP